MPCGFLRTCGFAGLFALTVMGAAADSTSEQGPVPGSQAEIDWGGGKKETEKEVPAATPSEDPVPDVSMGALVIIKGEGGSGSGFLVKMRERTFLVTNIHVIASLQKIEMRTALGHAVQVDSTVFLSRTRDVAMFRVLSEHDALPVMEDMAANVRIRDRIAVMGNSQGAGVVTRLDGELLGIGPDRIEINAGIVQGNSGSPILHAKTGMVVGIASYMVDLSTGDKWEQGTDFSRVRRFGFRVDNTDDLEGTTMNEVYRQNQVLEEYRERSVVLANLIGALCFKRTILTAYRSDRHVGHLVSRVDGFNWDRGLSSPENRRLLDNYIYGLKTALSVDDRTTDQALRLGYFRGRFEEYRQFRQHFQRVIDNFKP